MRWAASLALVAALCLATPAERAGAQAAPGAPTGISLLAGAGSFTVSWSAPAVDGGSAITSYDLRHIETAATDKADANWTVVSVWTSGDLSYTLAGLRDSTGYDVQVRAANAHGAGSWSGTSAGTTSDHGDTVSAATAITVGSEVPGRIHAAGDTDHFTFTLDGATYVLLEASTGAGTLSLTPTLYDDHGAEVYLYYLNESGWSVIDDGGLSMYALERLKAGTYTIRIAAAAAGQSGSYLLKSQIAAGQVTDEETCEGYSTAQSDPSTAQSDPLYGCQWHLKNTQQYGTGGGGFDINVEQAWATTKGEGINVLVVDRGLDYLHSDLRGYEYESGDSNDDSLGHHDPQGSVRHPRATHGTYVAGVIAARDNDIGTRGVAPRATVYGYTISRGGTQSFNEARARRAAAASHMADVTAVSSNSWRIASRGTYAAATDEWRNAIESGITSGYGGKGVLYVWLAGNFHASASYANRDEMLVHHGVTVVCAVNYNDVRTTYSERGDNLWLCAPSGDPDRMLPGIATTALHNEYNLSFGGTSAATPIVSGVAALVRAANTALTWRDVKLILAGSARRNDASNTGWEQGALAYGSTTDRYWFNTEYGFGVVDAGAAVELATGWTNLPPFRERSASASPELAIPDRPEGGTAEAASSTVTLGPEVEFVEYASVELRFSHGHRDDIQVDLTSPAGTVSELFPAFESPNHSPGFRRSVTDLTFYLGASKHLGESAEGTWTLRVSDTANGLTGTLHSWTLTVHGHGQKPLAPGVTSASTGAGALTVAWTAPADTGGSDITSYDARSIRSDATDKSDAEWTEHTGIWSAGDLEGEVTGLEDGVAYDVQLRAVNSGGGGLWSETVGGATASPPGEPRIASVVARDGGLGLTWTAPASDGGAAVDSYDARTILSTSTAEEKAGDWPEHIGIWTSTPGGDLRGTIAGLTNGDGYDVQLRAVNAVDPGSWSATSTGTPDLPADTSPTLVSNAVQGEDHSSTNRIDRSQTFTTSVGATLSSVEIISEDLEGDDATVSLCRVDGSNHPTSTCTVLTAPPSFAAGTLVFRAPANTTLAANTTYSLLIASPGGEWLLLDATDSDNEDAGGATDWSIANTFDTETSSDTWVVSDWALRITIKGTLNNAPTVATAIPDQTATSGTAFSYQVPAATFADADGDTLTYTATLADDTALPSWLSFSATTRTFSGTPTAAETVSVKVTASDASDSVSDTFDIVVSATTGICSRTAEVQTALLARTGRATCSDVTAADLVAVTSLTVNTYSGTSLDPADFAGLTGLTSLRFSGDSAQLTTLPDNAFAGATALTHLDFSFLEKVTTVAADAFNGLTALEKLNLSFNKLETLPEDAFDGLTALRILDLSFNVLTSLHENIFDGLTALEELHLSFNTDMAALDADIFEGLIALDTLQLGYIGQTTLHADIFDGLTALRILALSDNFLTTLDADIFEGRTNLEAVALNNNLLTTLDADIFDGLTALIQVYLSGNLLTTLDADLFDGRTALREILLDHNSLDTLDANLFDGLTALEELQLQDNRLTALDANLFEDLTALDSLDLNCNYFTALDFDIFDPFAATLIELNLQSDSFTTPPVASAIQAKFPSIVDFSIAATTCSRVTVAPTSLTVTEGATGTYTVALRAPPLANVTVAISSDNTKVTLSPTTPLTFTASNWDTPQMVTVSAAQDTDYADESATLILDPSGSNYDFVSSTALTVVVVDDDDPAVTTLVSNAGQGEDSIWRTDENRSQAFTTGAMGATLSSVEIISEDSQGNDLAVSVCTVNASNHPTSSCTALTPPSSFAAGTLLFTDASNMTLAANTTYSVLVTSPGGEQVTLDATTSDNEDTGGAMGWSIANGFDQKNASDVWVADNTSLRITIKGTLNNAPTVATAIPDQTATTGTAFSYAFPPATFNDADSDTLTYTATKSDDTALPAWLSFTAATRAFSGTPHAADVETVSVKVTASDGNGGSVSDTFDIVADLPPDTSPTLVSNAGQGGNSTFSISQDRAQAFTTSAGATLSSVEIISKDPDGDDVAVSLCTVDGSNHPTSSCTPLTAPPSFAAGTLVFRAPANTTLTANTTYSLLVASPGRDLLVLGVTSSDNEDAGGATDWSIANTFDYKISTNVWVNTTRALYITIKGTIAASSNNAPTVATEIPDQTATAGTALDYTFPADTFTDADGDTLTYTATKSDDTALPSWLSFSAATRTFSGTPTAAETVSVKVTASDGNSGSVSDTFDIVVGLPADTTAPRVASIVRETPTSSPTNADSLTWRVTFSEAVSNVDAADFVVSGTTATVTAVAAVSGVTGAYDVTASGGNLAGVSATVGLAIASSHNIQDGASNALSNTVPTGTNDNSYVVDNTAPTVAISGVPAISDAPFTATFTFPEAVTGFAVGDITLGNATASSFTVTSTTVYTALVTPTAAGAVTVDVPANAAQDAAGNGNTAATRASSAYTGSATRGVTVSATALTVNEDTTGTYTVVLDSEPTANVTVTPSRTGSSDVTFSPATLTFTALNWNTVQPVTVTAAHDSDAVDDSATISHAVTGGDYVGVTVESVVVTVDDDETADTTAPRVASIVRETPTSSPTNADSLTWRVTFSEAVSNVDAADFVVSGTTATVTAVAAVSGLTGAYDVSASGGNLAALNATVTLAIAASHNIEDGASNSLTNTAPTGTNDNSYVVDNTAPSVTISGVPAISDAPFTATFTFPEAVTGFAVGDITLGNATASSFTVTSTTVYAALVTPTATGAVTVDVPANAAQDAAGNGNTAATRASSAYTGSATRGVTVSATVLTVTEGSTGAYTVVLDSQPTANVTVTPSRTGSTDVAFSPATLTFTALNWNTVQPVTVTAAHDSDAVDDSATISHAVTGGDYVGVTVESVVVTVDDDESVDTVPGVPTDLSASSGGNTQINLSWTAPGADGGSPITGYKIEVSPGGNANWTELVATGNTTTTYAHIGLAVGTTRHYRVSAINSVGAGDPSNIDDATVIITTVTLRTQSIPEGIGTAAVLVTLNQPAGDPLSVPWYTLNGDAVSPGDYTAGGGQLIIPSGATSATISITIIDDADAEATETVLVLLSPGEGYVLGGSGATVSILDDDGDGPAPIGATVNGTTVVLTYNKPLDGASTPSSTAFHLRVADNRASVDEVSVNGSEVTLTLASPVQAGQTVSLDYTQPMSDPIQDGSAHKAQSFTRWYLVTDSTITKPAITVPGVPTDLSASTGGDTLINLSWTAPGDDGGSPITGYKIEVSPDGNANWTELVANTGNTTTTYAHIGLAAGTTRHYRVSAINSAGAGRPSNIDDATVIITTVTLRTQSIPEGIGTAAVLVTLNQPAGDPLSVPWYTLNGDAVSPGDYTAGGGQLIIPPGATSATISITIIDDADAEATETVLVLLSPGEGYVLGGSGATVSILDDDGDGPAPIGATVNGTTVVLTYNKPLDGASTPSSTAFHLRVADNRASVDEVSVNGSEVTLTLASPVQAGQTVSLDYTQPMSNPIQDASGNNKAQSFTRWYLVTGSTITGTADTTAPRVASITRQNPTVSPTNADSLTWRVTFSEAVSNVDAADFVVSGTTATVTAVAAVSGVTGAYDVTASGGNLAGVSATVGLAIASSHNIQDGASNALSNTVPTGTNDNSYVVDNTAPTVTISGVPATSDAPFTATFTFLEAVTGFAAGDITLGNATASSFTVTSTTVYTALVTPTADGAVTVDVPANAAQDAAGNGNTAATRASSAYALPAITIVAGTSPVTEGTPAVFTLSRTGSPIAALTVNVTVSETGGDMVAAANEGARTVTFLANSATATLSVATAPDSVDEADSVVTATVSADTGSPASYSVATPASAMVTVQDNDTRGVTVSATALTVNEGTTGTYTVVLDSQPTASVTVTPSRTGSSDVTFSPATLTFTASTWDTVQPVTVTAAQDSDAVDDSATISHAVTGGDYAGVTVESVVVTVDDDETADTTAPRVASIVRQNPTGSPTNADSLTWRVTFSEAVSNVDAADFVVSGTTATVTAVAAVSGVTGAYDVTASGGNLAGVSATVGLAIAASHNIQDGASNALSNTAPTGTNDNSYVVDNTAPSVTISGVPAISDAPFTATFTFLEAVTGFAAGDITLGNATASSFTVTSTTVYAALVTPTATGAVTVDVPANAAQDAAGNGNTAATRASSAYTGSATRGVTVSATALTVNEDTTGTYTVVLDSEPTANVTVTPSRTGSSDVTFSPATLTFTALNWNTVQPVTVTAAHDSDAVDDSATISHAVTGGDYVGVTVESVVVTVDDDESVDTVPGVPTDLSASSGGNTQINLSWTAPGADGGSPITGYKIEVSPGGNANWTELVTNTGNTTTTYAHIGLAAGTTRHYRVSAINSAGAGDPSNIDDATTRPITGPITGGGGGGGAAALRRASSTSSGL